ncbi:MAG TPA: NF038122 family metalloprotease [Pyrinomonadaceae bacterium]|nr:NF038122 family metalloprotease [Pyrinomonadaceae bacterium]
MRHSRAKFLAAIALAAIAISIFGRGVASRGFISVFSGVSGEPSTTFARRANLPFQTVDEPKSKPRPQFTIYRNAEGEIVCRRATEDEIRERESINPNAPGLRRINHFELTGDAAQPESIQGTGLTIILRATQQLQQNSTATAAFTRAAQNWEAIVMSPITIFIDVDFGPTNFGQTWPSGVLGATAVPSQGYPYQSVRTNLVAEANGEGNATKQAIFNALPSTTVPTDLGNGGGTDVADANGRAIGLLPAAAQSTDAAARIGFNSNFSFDFDPSDGVTAGQTDFDAVATHEIGHALGLSSDAGTNIPRPSVWDFYRFRTGTTSGTFTNAQRIMTIGGSPDPLQFFFVPGNSELGLSNGGPAGSNSNGGDGSQSSHWKHVSGCVTPIGVMDPAIPSGCRRIISANDQLALSSFGYNLTNNNAPPPPPPSPTPPPNDNFANAQTIVGCSGSTTGVNFGATSEGGEPSHDPPDSTSLSPSHTVWYQWPAPSSGSITITTAGSDFDTILAVYTGSSVGSLTRLVFNDDVQDGVIRTSTVTFNATAGTTYSIAVDGWGGDMGGLKLNWNGCIVPTPTPTPSPTATPTPTPTPTPLPTPLPGTEQIVISQVYAVGFAGGATFQNNYVELFNRGASVVNINSWFVQFGSDTGVIDSAVSFSPSGAIFIQPRQYMLLQLGSTSGTSLPVAPDLTTSLVFNRFAGKVFISRPGTPFLGGNSCPLPNTGITDFLGYGPNANCFEGASGPLLTNTTALFRKGGGCTDTDNNANDFMVGPPNPRNSHSPFNPCGENPIMLPDFFVKQHYQDFLNRTADQSGLTFWMGTITSCINDAQCTEVKRINASAAFFLSIEFQQTGNLIYKMYKAGFGNLQGKPVAVDRTPFMNDTRQIQSTPAQVIVGQGNWQAQLEANKQAFALAFVQRSAFQTQHAGQTADQYVASLFLNTGANPTSAETTAAVNAFNGAGGGDAGRAAALRSVAESNSVQNKLVNEAFVLMQYFGYLQRNPYDPPEATLDYQGYNFWLGKLNSFGGDYIKAEMVKGFIASDEYRHRFGP